MFPPNSQGRVFPETVLHIQRKWREILDKMAGREVLPSTDPSLSTSSKQPPSIPLQQLATIPNADDPNNIFISLNRQHKY
jgi:hypothetical protein